MNVRDAARLFTRSARLAERCDDDGERSRSPNPHPPPDIQCGCNQECLKKFSKDEIEAHRLNLCDMEKEEKDLLVMGVLLSGQFESHDTRRGKRKHDWYRYSFQGEKICAGAFRYLYDIGKKAMRSLKRHLAENGAVPRVHGNRGRRPHNALLFPDVEHCAAFIKRYSEDFGLPHPAPLHGRAEMPPVYLPASKTYKSVHAEYVAACQNMHRRAAGISVFRSIWRSCFPHIKFMTARTDVCLKCEQLRQSVMGALDDDAKLAALGDFTAHVHQSERERECYNAATRAAHAELQEHHPLIAPPYPPCSQPLKAMHYTFDFAQQVTLPHMYRQPGPLYFKTPRKVQLFGVCSEGVPKQVNYLLKLDEQDTIGPNGTKSHGANTVVSLLHHFFTIHGHGEEECVLHADNCAGQKKNRTVLNYLAWRVLLGLHKKITLSFMIAGHTRCLVDGCFGLLKKKYRRSDVFTLAQLGDVVNHSAACNIAQQGSDVNYYEWDTFFDTKFKKVKGISKLHHFTFTSTQPGKVETRDFVESVPQLITMLKTTVEDIKAAGMPPTLQRGGITAGRAEYLHKEIREFVPDAYKDELCPPP